MTTPNLGLAKVTTAQTNKDFYDAFNGNMDILDGKPLPTDVVDNSASNNALSSMKFADGTLLMWGKVFHAAGEKPVNIQWEGNGGAGWASDTWQVNFPVECVVSPVIIPWVVDSMRCETFVISSGAAVTTTSAEFRYWCNVRDNGGSKTAHLVVIGRWKASN